MNRKVYLIPSEDSELWWNGGMVFHQNYDSVVQAMKHAPVTDTVAAAAGGGVGGRTMGAATANGDGDIHGGGAGRRRQGVQWSRRLVLFFNGS